MTKRRHELYGDIDVYLERRRKKHASQSAPPIKKSRPEITEPPEEPPMETHPAEHTEYEQSHEGWWSRLKKGWSKPEQTAEQPPMEPALELQMPPTGQTVEDMKEVARIALIVLRKMTPEQTREFKMTPDYEKFKEILRKYQMIK